jgi:hypothetical protein
MFWREAIVRLLLPVALIAIALLAALAGPRFLTRR